MNGIIAALKEVDEETAKILKEVVKALFDIAGAGMREEMAQKPKMSSPGQKN